MPDTLASVPELMRVHVINKISDTFATLLVICSNKFENVESKFVNTLLPFPKKYADSSTIDPVVVNPVMFALVAYCATLYDELTSVHVIVPADVPAG